MTATLKGSVLFCVALLVAALLVAACGDEDAQRPVGPGGGGNGGSGAADGGGAMGGSGGAGGGGGGGESLVTVTLFHTTDEHGHLQPDDTSSPLFVNGGAAYVRSWLGDAGYQPGEHLLVSSGDSWSGPAISTWVEGASTVEVMNTMGYVAQAIGNHEFDFGSDVLAARETQASFPMLSANVVFAADGSRPAWATPYTVLPAGGVMLGLVGLTTTMSATSGHPKYVRDLDFTDYVDALDTFVPQARSDGAQIIVVLAHVCAGPLGDAVQQASVDIDLALGGHCHNVTNADADGVQVVVSGEHFLGFSRIDLTLDSAAGEVVDTVVAHTAVRFAGNNPPLPPDADVQSVIDGWQQQIDADLAEAVGHTSTGFPTMGWKTANWVVDAWLAEHPTADVAILNFGSLRTAIPPGDFTLQEMVGIMPFENDIVSLDITGAQIQETILTISPAVGGMTYRTLGGGVVEVTLTGAQVFDPSATYTLLTTDFLYYGGAGTQLESYDPTPVELGDHMRDPVITWTQQLMTSAADPVEDHIDATPRNQ